MKGDISRDTFEKKKHYDSVRAQQGRVMLDADLNEQADITRYRGETGSGDVIGTNGAPFTCPGFHIITDKKQLTSVELAIAENNMEPAPTAKPPDFLISAGRLYVDGVPCENDALVSYLNQPDLPGFNPQKTTVSTAFLATLREKACIPKESDSWHLAYLDCWKRHVVAIDDPAIREIALGGPDTATRSRIVWQVKILNLKKDLLPGQYLNPHDTETPKKWQKLQYGSGLVRQATETGRLFATIRSDSSSPGPCSEVASSGYSGSQNQLYRVEIHRPGKVNADPKKCATFKWSRENGSVTIACTYQSDTNKLKLNVPKVDSAYGLAEKDWVEITDETHELWEIPGHLARISKLKGTDMDFDPALHDWKDFSDKPRVRRWEIPDITYQYDTAGNQTSLTSDKYADDNAIPLTSTLWYELEENIIVRFEPGKEYRTGDYWLIPARTLTPEDLEGWKADTPQLPHGPAHQYAPLAVLHYQGKEYDKLSDCRPVFPPLTGLTAFFSAGGDGQEVLRKPGTSDQTLPLPRNICVGVANDRFAVENAKVRFTLLSGCGTLNGVSSPVETYTNSRGLAGCAWQVGRDKTTQSIEAVLLDEDEKVTHPPVFFTATVRTIGAGDVGYSPANCPRLAGTTTVQAALDTLCRQSDSLCTVIVTPEDWETAKHDWAAFLKLTGQQDVPRTGARICFQAGTYEFDAPLTFSGYSHLQVTGCGPATRVLARNLEAAFVFDTCSSVVVTDIAATSSSAIAEGEGKVKHLNGTLTFYHCSRVTVARATLTCGEGIWRAASCITVRNAEKSPVGTDDLSKNPPVQLVRIRDCDLHVGHKQAGILLVNVSRSDISGNSIEVYDRTALKFIHVLKDRMFAKSISRFLIPVPVLENAGVKSPGKKAAGAVVAERKVLGVKSDTTSVSLITAKETMIFTPARELKKFVSPYIAKLLPRNIKNAEVKYAVLVSRMAAVLANEGKLKDGVTLIEAGDSNIFRYLDAKYGTSSFGAQGIVIGGQFAKYIRIHNNALHAISQGIHIGLSRHEAAPAPGKFDPVYAGRVSITDNEIDIRMMQGIRTHHGIFVGNCVSQVIERNQITVSRLSALKTERATTTRATQLTPGIQVFGHLGPMMVIGENHVTDADTGISVTVQNEKAYTQPQWLVLNNYASKKPCFSGSTAKIQSVNNIP